MIRVEGLTKDFGNRRAIDNLTFDARKGEILGFLGPNGAGKTTTMRILCGFMPPTSGKAEVAGHDVIGESLDVRKKVGYMPETVPLYPDMTVFDYLKFMADLRRLPEAENRVDEILEKLGLEDRADGYIANLSKGMRQRVGLAQALVHSPEVLILDEPTIGLDPAQIIEVRNLIRELGREHTILLSTHILSEAQQVCNRVMIINKGRIVAEDTPELLQARLAGAKRVVVRVSGDSDGLDSAIQKVAGVTQVNKIEDGKIEFETEPGRDPSPEVARAVVEGGYSLVEFRPVGLSLEDIFLQLTRDEPAPLEMASEETIIEDSEVIN
ncbi:MAG: MFS transporter [Chloroflexi bacterium RBG_16_54_18]|nr:MAG: MFS transporter [Chloroflexi bacterium RBG_16_54_18]